MDKVNLIDLYKKHGPEFTKLLDGEFALCLIDFSEDIILISTDTFACKPLWYEFQHDKFCIGSYNSQLTKLGFNNGVKLYSNSTNIYQLSTGSYLRKFTNFEFNINQHKNNFNDWIMHWLDIRTRGLPLTPNLKLAELLSSPVEIARWVSEGLNHIQLQVQKISM